MKKKIFIFTLLLVMAGLTFGQEMEHSIKIRPTSTWWRQQAWYNDDAQLWAREVEDRLEGAAGLGAGQGTVYYVDNNSGSNSDDGLTWDDAFLTITYAMAVSHANIATSPNYADRNMILVRGDDFDEDWTKLAQKTDIIGVGSDDGNKGPRILGNHVIEAAGSGCYMGCRFFNMTFLNQTAADHFTIPTGQNGIEWICCRFESSGSAAAPSAIDVTACNDTKIIGCDFISSTNKWAAGAIDFGAGVAQNTQILGNYIVADIGITTDAGTTGDSSRIEGNTIQATTLTIDDNSDVFIVVNNELISDADLGVAAYDFNTSLAAQNWVTGANGSTIIPAPNFEEGEGDAWGSDNTYYVDVQNGNDGESGRSWTAAFATIQQAVDSVDDYDTILVRSTATITETVTTVAGDIGCRLIGVSLGKTNPNWQSSGVGTNTLIMNGPNWEVKNFLFTGATRTVPYIYVAMTANGTIIDNCYFHGGGDCQSAIQFYGAPPQCKLLNCHITAFGGAMAGDIAAVWGNYGTMSANDYEIVGNWFTNNTDHIDLASNNCLYKDNHFHTDGEADDAATVLDTYGSGEDTGFNTIVDNYFGDQSAEITQANGYIFSTTDQISGNHCIDGDYPKQGPEGNEWYVDNYFGNAANSGRSWGQALTSIEAALALADNFDTIYIKGGIYTNYEETVDTMGQDKPGLKFIGIGEGIMTPAWQGAAAGEHALIIQSSNVEVRNIRFNDTKTHTVAAIEVDTDGYRGDASVIDSCYFDGQNIGHSAVEYSGGSMRNTFTNNKVVRYGMANAAGEAAVWVSNDLQNMSEFTCTGNFFSDNVDHLNMDCYNSVFKDNHFIRVGSVRTATVVLDPTCEYGTNTVTQNTFSDMTYQIDNAHGYYGMPTDNWAGNYCADGLSIEKYPGAGAATTEVNGVRSVSHTTMTITGTMTDTSYGDDDDPVIFTVTGDIICRAFAIVNSEVTTNNDDGTLSLGVTGDEACLLVSDTADNTEFQANDCWTLDQPPETPSAELNDSWVVIPNGLDITLFIGTNHCTAGVVTFYLEWIPMSADAEVVGAAP